MSHARDHRLVLAPDSRNRPCSAVSASIQCEPCGQKATANLVHLRLLFFEQPKATTQINCNAMLSTRWPQRFVSALLIQDNTDMCRQGEIMRQEAALVRVTLKDIVDAMRCRPKFPGDKRILSYCHYCHNDHESLDVACQLSRSVHLRGRQRFRQPCL